MDYVALKARVNDRESRRLHGMPYPPDGYAYIDGRCDRHGSPLRHLVTALSTKPLCGVAVPDHAEPHGDRVRVDRICRRCLRRALAPGATGATGGGA